MGEHERNAIIKSARIVNDDHNLLSAWLDLDYGGSGQGFGGFSLYLPKSYAHHVQALKTNFAGHFIWRVMEIAEVTEWSRLVGKTIRALQEHQGVKAIGHIIRDDWFYPETDFGAMKHSVS